MRIRKHAKISPLMYSTSALAPQSLLQTHVCLLNQSPWDVITFPPADSSTLVPSPPPYLVDKDDSFTGNGSLGDSVGAVESAASMKISLEGEEDMKADNAQKWAISDRIEKGENGEETENQLGFKKGDITLCCKTDGKGWHCRREAKEGHSLCEHHLNQLRNYNSLAHPASKKADKPAENRRRPRAKKASAAANPHEFYYYSGFGPLWGKKRGPGRDEDKMSGTTDLISPVEHVAPVAEASATPSSSSQIDNNEEFDYVEDETDDNNNKSETGKKRARKPIKARSLKSLM